MSAPRRNFFCAPKWKLSKIAFPHRPKMHVRAAEKFRFGAEMEAPVQTRNRPFGRDRRGGFRPERRKRTKKSQIHYTKPQPTKVRPVGYDQWGGFPTRLLDRRKQSQIHSTKPPRTIRHLFNETAPSEKVILKIWYISRLFCDICDQKRFMRFWGTPVYSPAF